MCEIAILDPQEYTPEELAQYAMSIYRAQGDSLGLVFVQENEERTKFQYGVYKSINPDADNVEEFTREYIDSSVRVIMHGRLATHGEVTPENAHPININCDECNIDMMMHNGIVARTRKYRREHESAGHEYDTNVDSESIAHAFGDVPDDIDTFREEYPVTDFARQPAFVLLNDERIYISNSYSKSYQLEANGLMCRNRNFGPERDRENNYTGVIYSPRNANNA